MAGGAGALLATAVLAIGLTRVNGFINNFRFKHSNSFTGNVLPFHAQISGSYYVDLLGTPELSYIHDSNMKGVVTAASLRTSTLPVVCTGAMGGLLAKVNAQAHDALAGKLSELAKYVMANKADAIRGLFNRWSPFVDTSDPEYKCRPLRMEVAPNTSHAFVFKTVVEFEDYRPIYFVDQLGVGMFTYSRSNVPKDMGHSSGNPVRYCGGTGYTGDMYTVEARPKCPMATPPKARRYGRAIITVYKPNIVSVRRNVTRCLQQLTHIQSRTGWAESHEGGSRKTKNVRTSPDYCREWKRTLDPCMSFKMSAVREKDDYSINHYDVDTDQCKLYPLLSQNNAGIAEFRTHPILRYYWGGWYKSYSRDVRSATLTNGFMEVSMPSMTAVSPWVNIPKKLMSKGEYEVNNMTVVWKPFREDELCPFVPRFRGEVKYIKYKHGDYNVPIDPRSDDEAYTLFLVADQYGALFNADSSQIIRDTSKLVCMPHKSDYRTTLYQTGGDQIIMVTVVDDGGHDAHERSHIPSDVAHIGTDEQPHEGYAAVHYDATQNKVVHAMGHNAMTPQKSRPGSRQVLDLEAHYNSVERSSKSERGETTTDAPSTNSTDVSVDGQGVTAMDSVRYLRFQMVETQRHNLHVRAVQQCFTNQLNWDVYTQLLEINPSRAISNRLNVAVEASFGGNGFFNVKRCELANDVVVVPTLRTDSDERVSVNGKEVTLRDIAVHLGVKPDVNKCFTMPILVFTSPSTGVQVVGQLTLDGVINTQTLTYLEACVPNKAFVFIVNQFGYFFYDYKMNFTETAAKIRNETDKFLVASSMSRMQNQDHHEAHRQHALSKIHVLSIVEPANLREKEFKHYPTGLFSNDMYSVGERQSISLGLMKLMEAENFDRFAMKTFREAWEDVSEGGGGDMGFFFGGGSFLGGVGDMFLKIGEGGGALLHGFGGGLGEAAAGVGKGLGDASKGFFGGIGDALKGTFMALALPLVAIAVLAIVGVIVYKQLTGKSSEDHHPPTYDQVVHGDGADAGKPYPPDQLSIEQPNQRKGFTFGNR